MALGHLHGGLSRLLLGDPRGLVVDDENENAERDADDTAEGDEEFRRQAPSESQGGGSFLDHSAQK
ncbi:hypothetical protein JRI60_24955 [Archangium violaceum]|uniref:hypothetical protein n=1 Tax=Archangium violaceum TaxID=83451 RepID=UPI00194E4F5D|nr:hypothetical protein [Archangium violaceum]QRO02032.1 hypothetical protein JRI60_24955 [Archangium violaceum]